MNLGLAMPFISRIVGDYVFHKESNVYKRFLFGAATYLSVKGVITLVRKYKFRRWLRERKVKDFEGTVLQSVVYTVRFIEYTTHLVKPKKKMIMQIIKMVIEVFKLN